MTQPADAPSEHTAAGSPWPRPRDLALAAGLFAVCAVVATWPAAARMSAELPSGSDPVQHLWIMRWYKQCLLDGRSPFVAPEAQYPAGAPLAFFSPMHLQSALYLPLSLVVPNDVLIYNLLWFAGFISTGLGGFVLASVVLGHRGAALVAGLVTMLGAPVMIHSIGHLELIYLGAVPLFLACWIRLVDRPSRGRLLAAVGAYLLTTMSAAYYALLVVFPAALYAIPALIGRPWGAPRATRRDLRCRWGALFGFVVLALPGVVLLFGAQVWGALHGLTLARSRVEFEAFGSPLWSYFTPTHFHRLAALWPINVHIEAGHGSGMVETASYLGLVSLLLLHRAARRPGSIPRAAFWWAGLALMVVLSFGAKGAIGKETLSLPSSWLWRWFPPFQLIRMPVRFNLLAVIFAAVLAGAGCRDLLESIRNLAWRRVVLGLLMVLAVADLGFAPYPQGYRPPELPASYAEILAVDPHATFLDAPTAVSSGADPTSSLACYWQSSHGGRTTAGYSGLPNPAFDDRVFQGSPFSRQRLADPDYLIDASSMAFGLVEDVAFDAYVWLFLQANDLRYLVLHDRGLSTAAPEAVRQRLLDRLVRSRVAEGDGIRIYDRERMPRPRRPALVCLDGWRRRPGWLDPRPCLVEATARLGVYLPEPNATARLRIEAWAAGEPVTASLRAEGVELARWVVEPDGFHEYEAEVTAGSSGYRECELELSGTGGEPTSRRGPVIRVRSLRLDDQLRPAPESLAAATEPGPTTTTDLGRMVR